MNDLSINQLIERCVQFFQEQCYTEHRISKYKSLWRTGILRFMLEKKQSIYTTSIGKDFLLTCHYNGEVRHQELEKIRSVHVLDDMLATGSIRKKCITHVVHPLNGRIGIKMELLISHLQNLRRSKKTISDYRLYLSGFLNYLTSLDIYEVAHITEYHILKYIGNNIQINKCNIVSALRMLFRFWHEQSVITTDLSLVFISHKWAKKEKIPSYYTGKEVFQVESSIKRSSNTGKRNYAMLLLASRLGLRASDIAGLQFTDIDWDRNLITLTMNKTGKIIELPLLVDVGNAIIDYLRNGRPNSYLRNVFLSSRAPYTAATKSIVCSEIQRSITQSGICIEGKHHGPHSMRHSLASTLLRNGTTIPVISEVLGHRSTQTTMIYLSIDITSLMYCALPVSLVLDNFYNQKGGVFYE